MAFKCGFKMSSYAKFAKIAGLEIHSSVFWVNHLFVAKKLSESLICSKIRVICSFSHFWCATWANCSWWLIFGERPEQFSHSCSFVMSNLIRSNPSLKKREQANHCFKKTFFVRFAQKKWVICSFALLPWVTWENGSWSLFCHEWS